jgi:hypothetical protein
LGGCSLWVVIKKYKSGANFWITFSQQSSYVSILAINGLGYILGYFSQTHLIALFGSHCFEEKPHLKVGKGSF